VDLLKGLVERVRKIPCPVSPGDELLSVAGHHQAKEPARPRISPNFAGAADARGGAPGAINNP